MTFDGSGNVIAGLEDLDDTGNIYLSMPFSGGYSSLDANGRATMTMTGFSPHLQSIGSNTTTQFVLNLFKPVVWSFWKSMGSRI